MITKESVALLSDNELRMELDNIMHSLLIYEAIQVSNQNVSDVKQELLCVQEEIDRRYNNV